VWNGIGCSWDGQIYLAVTDHKEITSGIGMSALFHYDPYQAKWECLGTNKAASQRAGNWMPMESQAKVHSPIVEIFNGEMWMATHDNSDDNITRWHRGSHWYAVDARGVWVDKSAEQDSAPMLSREGCIRWDQNHQVDNPKLAPTESTGIAIHYESIMAIGYNPQKPGVIFGSTYPRTMILRHDFATKSTRVVGSGRDIFVIDGQFFNGVSREMVVDKHGNAYVPGKTMGGGARIAKYDFALDSTYTFQTVSESEWKGATHTWSGESIFVAFTSGRIYGLYPESDAFEYIADVGARCPNLIVSQDARSLYAIPANSTSIKKINIATGAINSFGSVPSCGYPYSHNTRDTLGWAYYSCGGHDWDRMFKVYLGKNELGPYKKPEYAAIKSTKNGLVSGPELMCYPNPFSTSVDITFSMQNANIKFQSSSRAGTRDAKLKIFNTQGKIMHSAICNLQSAINGCFLWDASGHPPGVYLVTLKSDRYLLKQKIILTR
jgi:hypothetical protein